MVGSGQKICKFLSRRVSRTVGGRGSWETQRGDEAWEEGRRSKDRWEDIHTVCGRDGERMGLNEGDGEG